MNPTHPELAHLLHAAMLTEDLPISTMHITVKEDGWVRLSVTGDPELTADEARRYATALELTGVYYGEPDPEHPDAGANIQGRLNGWRVQINCAPEVINMRLPGEAA